MDALTLKHHCQNFLQNPNAFSLRGLDGITNEQGESLEKLITRFVAVPEEIQIGIIGEPNVIMTRWDNLWIGIETDGYAHS
jgi:hypothetical protein